MAKEAVVQNYSDEVTQQVVSEYKSGVAVEVIAANVGKSVRSVIAKLSREGVYVAKQKAAGEKGVTKSDLVAKIADKFGVEVEKLASLEKATKEALAILAA